MKRSHIIFTYFLLYFFVVQLLPRLFAIRISSLWMYPVFFFVGIFLFKAELLAGWKKIRLKIVPNLLLLVAIFLASQIIEMVFSLGAYELSRIFHISLEATGNETSVSNFVHHLPLLISFLYIAILGPVVEELIFRQIVQSSLSKKLPIGLAISLQALLFALNHIKGWTASEFIQVLPYIGSGLVLGYARYKTDNLWHSMMPHMLANALVLLV